MYSSFLQRLEFLEVDASLLQGRASTTCRCWYEIGATPGPSWCLCGWVAVEEFNLSVYTTDAYMYIPVRTYVYIYIYMYVYIYIWSPTPPPQALHSSVSHNLTSSTYSDHQTDHMQEMLQILVNSIHFT